MTPRLTEIRETLVSCLADLKWTRSATVKDAVSPRSVVVSVPDSFIDYRVSNGPDAHYTLHLILLVAAVDKSHGQNELAEHLDPESDLITAIEQIDFPDGGSAQVAEALNFGSYDVGSGVLYGVTLVVNVHA